MDWDLVLHDLLGMAFRVANDVDTWGEGRESSPYRAMIVEHFYTTGCIDLKSAIVFNFNGVDPGAGTDIFGEIIAKVRGLVVSHILPTYGHAIGTVMHQTGHTMLGCDCRAVDIDF